MEIQNTRKRQEIHTEGRRDKEDKERILCLFPETCEGREDGKVEDQAGEDPGKIIHGVGLVANGKPEEETTIVDYGSYHLAFMAGTKMLDGLIREQALHGRFPVLQHKQPEALYRKRKPLHPSAEDELHRLEESDRRARTEERIHLPEKLRRRGGIPNGTLKGNKGIQGGENRVGAVSPSHTT